MPRKSDGHRWEYAEIPGGEYPRPAQRCARCGLVRQQHNGAWFYPANGWDAALDVWVAETEPPCTPERPATPTEGP